MCFNVKKRWKLHKPHWSIHINIVLDYNDWIYHNEICNNEVKWKAKLNNKHMGKWKLMHPILRWFLKKNMKRRRIKKKKEGEENGCEKRGWKKWKSKSHEMNTWEKITKSLMRSMFLCWAQTLIYHSTPSRIFWINKWLKCYNILIFWTFQDLYVDMRRLIVSQRWFEVVTIFHYSIWFSIFVEVHGLDNFFVNINRWNQDRKDKTMLHQYWHVFRKNIVISPNIKHYPFFDSSSSI